MLFLHVRWLRLKTQIAPCVDEGGEIRTWLVGVQSRANSTEGNLAIFIKTGKASHILWPSKSASEQKSLGYTHLCPNNKYTRIPLTKVWSCIFHHLLFLSPLLVIIYLQVLSLYLFILSVSPSKVSSKPSWGDKPGFAFSQHHFLP